ncbi:probable F420-dependent oxidoreductase, Rv1855c family [Nakamurella panacisegetis]|uniref:Probable F420-dependent oxidoreductase, Rv1855c family n=1 Tax=Nakamurella panacisegetis TaxID=1090615 RepID=A0A1H0KJT9_9ACTN|nr:LLM class F420-dependent oxidoreductase [Nakamurella panacisegetis]SDO56209.1 probable F420-dependent oxidoreductase, Rv1855c family [Nakamurella panacisegetis]
MRLGIQVSNFTWPGAPQSTGRTFRRIAVDAEQSGLASLWVMDHFFQIPIAGEPEDDMLEGWSALAFAAGATERIELGTLVTGVTYRHPGVLIKTATTLDVLSGGRAYLGIGAAWNEQEHKGLGVPYPPLKERFERLEDTLRLAHQMWQDDQSAFSGRHFALERPLNHPQPVSRPHPKILIGGMGERKTLRLVAQYADACNIFEMPVPAIKAKLDILQEHCDSLGRDYAEIEKTTLGLGSFSNSGARGSQSVEQALDRFGRLAEIGVDHAILSLAKPDDPASFELLPELAAAAARIVPAGR